ncbi:MAG TPA: peptidylprolyl isomerase [Gemmatimonadaceae bacterium]
MLQQVRSAAKYIWWFVALAFVGGFMFYEVSGLVGRQPLTPTTPVAVVNGREIRYVDWQAAVQRETESQQQRAGRSLTQDEVRQVEDAVLDQMIMDVLLEQEYRRRGIIATDDEVREYAKFAPPQWVVQSPELQTEGRFDPAKYQRFLASPAARQQGFLAGLEQYYRTEIPKQKLYDALSSGIYVTDAELWRAWRDQRDSVEATVASLEVPANLPPDNGISDGDLKAYFEAHKAEFDRTGRAVLSVLHIPRAISAADSARARAKAEALRAEILGGAKFEDVARRESADSASAVNGGSLGRGPKGRFVPTFEDAAYQLPVGQVSQPIATPFGYHLIRVDEKKGDTLDLRHILVRVQVGDSAAAAVDRKADELANLTAAGENPARFDSAAVKLGLTPVKAIALEGQPATAGNLVVPGASAWAFSGSKVGEVSELFDDENGYYVARVDSLVEGGKADFDAAKAEIRQRVTIDRAIEKLLPKAQQVAQQAAAGSLEGAAAAQGATISKTGKIARTSYVPALGQLTEAIGVAFGLPIGAISQPVKVENGVAVIRVDNYQHADSAAWAAQKEQQRDARLQMLRQQVVQQYMADLKKQAKIDDRRKAINAMARRAES